MLRKIKKFEELVASRNMADSVASSTRKAMDDNKGQLSKDEVKSLEDAIKSVEEACKKDDKSIIDKAMEELSKVAQPLSEKLFKKEEAQQNPPKNDDAPQEDAVDADFKEVDEDKKS
jgi:molecular chaperone DnaK